MTGLPGIETIPVLVLLWVFVVMALSGIVQGAIGLGFPMLATPLIALVTDMRTAVVVVLLPCLATIITSLYRSGPVKKVIAEFWMMPLCMLVGSAVGTRIFILNPGFPYAVLLAAIILVYLNLDRLGRTDWPLVLRHRRAFGVLFGLAAGLSEGTANAAAPPLVVYYLALGLTPATLVQALNICFFTGKLTQFTTLATSGTVQASVWIATLPLAAVAALATVYGVRIRNRIDAAAYRRWIKYALFGIAMLLLAQTAWRYATGAA